MTFEVVWHGVHEFNAALEGMVAKALASSKVSVVEAAAELERKAKSNASGRPGPNVRTGSLRRGIRHDAVTPWGAHGWETKVGPTVIYSRRIELGFHGADRRGRHYNQRGYPYFKPAFESVNFASIYSRNWRTALGL